MFKQGEKFKNAQKKYKALVQRYHYNLISLQQLNIVDNLKSSKFASINEAFTGASMNKVEEKNLAEKEKLNRLEGDFNNNMEEYIKEYKLYLKELASRQTNLNSRLKSKVVTYNNNKYYINNTGIAREFTSQSWKDKDNSCPESTTTLSPQEFSKLSMGPPMNIGELCRSGAYNAKNSETGTAAWVDSNGYKHIYDDFINRNKTCPAETVTITDTQFYAMPIGKKWGANDTCNVISLDSESYDKLLLLNQKLLTGVTQMKS